MAELPENVTVRNVAGEVVAEVPGQVRYTVHIELDAPGGQYGTPAVANWISGLIAEPGALPRNGLTVVRIDVEREDT